MKNKSDFPIDRVFREENEIEFRKEVSETSTEALQWEKEIAHENEKAKNEMALELRAMGFSSDAIARILHIKEAQIQPPDRNHTGLKNSTRKTG